MRREIRSQQSGCFKGLKGPCGCGFPFGLQPSGRCFLVPSGVSYCEQAFRSSQHHSSARLPCELVLAGQAGRALVGVAGLPRLSQLASSVTDWPWWDPLVPIALSSQCGMLSK